jgi:hypothetical protein
MGRAPLACASIPRRIAYGLHRVPTDGVHSWIVSRTFLCTDACGLHARSALGKAKSAGYPPYRVTLHAPAVVRRRGRGGAGAGSGRRVKRKTYSRPSMVARMRVSSRWVERRAVGAVMAASRYAEMLKDMCTLSDPTVARQVPGTRTKVVVSATGDSSNPAGRDGSAPLPRWSRPPLAALDRIRRPERQCGQTHRSSGVWQATSQASKLGTDPS